MPFRHARLPYVSVLLVCCTTSCLPASLMSCLVFFSRLCLPIYLIPFADLNFAVLHSVRRLAYFKHLQWEQEWIDELVETTCRIYDFDYTTVRDITPECTPDTSVHGDNVSVSLAVYLTFLIFIFVCRMRTTRMRTTSSRAYTALSRKVAPLSRLRPDKLTSYLNSPPEQPDNGNVLQWWHRQQAAYPHLVLMALNFLSIPGMLITWFFSDCD